MKYLIIIPIFILCACSNGQTAYNYRLEGKQFEKNGDCENAIISYEKAIQINPDYDTVLMNIGMCYWSLQEFEKAEIYFKRALEKNSKYDKVYLNLGRLLVSPESKLENFNKGIVYARNDKLKAEFYTLIGEVYFEQKRYRKALENYKNALSINPNDINLLRLSGTLHSYLFEFEDANYLHEKALRISPDDAETYNDYGASLQRQQKFSLAIEKHKIATSISSENFKYSYNLANAYFYNSNNNLALKEIQRCLILDATNIRGLLLKGKILLMLQDSDEACKTLSIVCSKADQEGISLSKLADSTPITIEHTNDLGSIVSLSEAIETTKKGLHPIEIVYLEAYLLKKHNCEIKN
jgi:tetratricopeptide (TPR) repeat protein